MGNTVEDETKKPTPEEELIAEHRRLLAYDGPDRIVSAESVFKRMRSQTVGKFVARSGIPAFDAALKGGFYPGQLIVVSGLTGEGKTTLCRTLTHAFACQGLNPLWFSYEEIPDEFLAKFPEQTLQLFYMPNELTDKTTAWVQERVYEGRIKHGCNVVFVDHLHFLIDLYRSRNASLEIGAVVRDFKRLALRHRVVFFLVCHVGKLEKKRELESGDTRDSSLIEQEADTVIMCWRKPKTDNVTTAKITKNRKGGRVKILVDLPFDEASGLYDTGTPQTEE